MALRRSFLIYRLTQKSPPALSGDTVTALFHAHHLVDVASVRCQRFEGEAIAQLDGSCPYFGPLTLAP